MVTRTGISFDKGLLKFFDKVIREKGYSNRSEAINDIVRDFLHREKKEDSFGIIKIVYDHRAGHHNKKIAELQHEYSCFIISSMRNYIDKHKCVEIISVRGPLGRINALLKKIKMTQGVKKADFIRI